MRKIKRFLSDALAVLMLITNIPVEASSAEITENSTESIEVEQELIDAETEIFTEDETEEIIEEVIEEELLEDFF